MKLGKEDVAQRLVGLLGNGIHKILPLGPKDVNSGQKVFRWVLDRQAKSPRSAFAMSAVKSRSTVRPKRTNTSGFPQF